MAYNSQGSHTGQLDFCNWLADGSTMGHYQVLIDKCDIFGYNDSWLKKDSLCVPVLEVIYDIMERGEKIIYHNA